jgi:hypothetical protein
MIGSVLLGDIVRLSCAFFAGFFVLKNAVLILMIFSKISSVVSLGFPMRRKMKSNFFPIFLSFSLSALVLTLVVHPGKYFPSLCMLFFSVGFFFGKKMADCK